jgi:ABC-type microcin C transport system permease subunit YejE
LSNTTEVWQSLPDLFCVILQSDRGLWMELNGNFHLLLLLLLLLLLMLGVVGVMTKGSSLSMGVNFVVKKFDWKNN